MFTKIGINVAFLALFAGLLAIIASFFFPIDLQAADFRQSFNYRQGTLLFSQGAMSVFSGLILGVLCEISNKLDR